MEEGKGKARCKEGREEDERIARRGRDGGWKNGRYKGGKEERMIGGRKEGKGEMQGGREGR